MKKIEIERKFLVKELPDLSKCKKVSIIQGYLSYTEKIRIRAKDNKFFLTHKGQGTIKRTEEETEINEIAFNILVNLIQGNLINKTRYKIPLENNLVAEIDVYHNQLEGLIVVETEFKSLEEAKTFEPPSWFGEDITADQKYKAKNLTQAEDIIAI